MTELERLAQKNGVDMTPKPSAEERIAELEKANEELRDALESLLRGDTE